jgi:hypothetical protein
MGVGRSVSHATDDVVPFVTTKCSDDHAHRVHRNWNERESPTTSATFAPHAEGHGAALVRNCFQSSVRSAG